MIKRANPADALTEAGLGVSVASPPLLSVIVPALEVDLELRRCLDSIRLALPEPGHCEIVLILPARHTAAAAQAFQDVCVVAETRPSVYAAMNDGVAASAGRYLYFIGKDDILLPSAGELARLLLAESPELVFADVYWGTRGLSRGRTSRWEILFRNVCHQGIVYSRGAFVAHGPYLRRFRVRADHLLNIRVLWDASLRSRARYLKLPLAWYAGTGLSQAHRDMAFYRIHPVLVRRYLGSVVACLWSPVWYLAYHWLLKK